MPGSLGLEEASRERARRIFIVLGVFRPDLHLFRRQVESILAQRHRAIDVLVCADGPLEEEVASFLRALGDTRMHLLAFDSNVGVHANFARGLREALHRSTSDGDLFAYCDQDDVWHPSKLEKQVARFADANVSLCHTDARVVSRDGSEVAPSLLAYESRARTASLTDLLVMNSVTGMTAVFRRDVAAAAASFPQVRSSHVLHDLWTALVASLLGRIVLIDEPLVDYVQHGDSVLGAQAWRGRLPENRAVLAGRRYLLRCYRQYLWRRNTFRELQQEFAAAPAASARMRRAPARWLFDRGTTRYAGLALVLGHALRGQRRQADQVWRLMRGKMLDCSRRKVPARAIAVPEEERR
jgi:glycosyltransferase involved in cell wall biosynthesis